MALVVQIERFSGSKQVVVLLDGDRLKFTVDSPTRFAEVLVAAKSLAKALGSPFEFEVTTARGYEPRKYD